jgi:hypothetical protein
MRKTIIIAFTLAILPCATLLAQRPERTPLLKTPHFVFYDDPEMNLNDALIAAGLARKNAKPELFQADAEAACFQRLAPSARAAWDGAVDYYKKVISPFDFGARQQYLVRLQLAGFESEAGDGSARQYLDLAAHFRAAAMPAYKACRWSVQDEVNRRWLEELKPRLAAHEEKIAEKLQQHYGKRWDAALPVDIVQTVDWSGANSMVDPVHLLVSIHDQGPAALELVFHEASHALMTPADPVRQALEEAARKAGFTLPRELWHVVLFYTTGETVRRQLEASGVAGYTPMIYGIFERGAWDEYRKPLEEAWRPYVNGKRPLAVAAKNLIQAIQKDQKKSDASKKP